MIIGIDQSMKSTAIIALNGAGEMIDFELIIPPLDLFKEQVIIYIWDNIHTFIKKYHPHVYGIALEGLAFTAIGSTKDLLYGIQWYTRTRIIVEYPTINLGVLTVQTWRASILTREEQKYWKTKYCGKIGLKHGVVDKLPEEVRLRFDMFLELNKDEINAVRVKDWKPGCRSQKYKESLFDLADAWGIATHRLILHNKHHKSLKLNKR